VKRELLKIPGVEFFPPAGLDPADLDRDQPIHLDARGRPVPNLFGYPVVFVDDNGRPITPLAGQG